MPLLPRNCKGYESRNRATAKLMVQQFHGSTVQRIDSFEP
jgi:hypothetical protein